MGATKIQAVYRGRGARAEVENLRDAARKAKEAENVTARQRWLAKLAAKSEAETEEVGPDGAPWPEPPWGESQDSDETVPVPAITVTAPLEQRRHCKLFCSA